MYIISARRERKREEFRRQEKVEIFQKLIVGKNKKEHNEKMQNLNIEREIIIIIKRRKNITNK